MEGPRRDEFEALTGALRSLPLRSSHLVADVPTRAHVYTSDKEWLTGLATLHRGYRDATQLAIKGVDVPGGTSGAPVFDDAGNVFGVVSADGDGTLMVYLPNAMPSWMWQAARDE
jgi:hypothetical protein